MNRRVVVVTALARPAVAEPACSFAAERRQPPIGVRQPPLVEYAQQQVEHLRRRLLDVSMTRGERPVDSALVPVVTEVLGSGR